MTQKAGIAPVQFSLPAILPCRSTARWVIGLSSRRADVRDRLGAGRLARPLPRSPSPSGSVLLKEVGRDGEIAPVQFRQLGPATPYRKGLAEAGPGLHQLGAREVRQACVHLLTISVGDHVAGPAAAMEARDLAERLGAVLQ